MFKPAKKSYRKKKYEKFAFLIGEFYRGAESGCKDGMVWVKIGKKRVWFDILFHVSFGNRNWGGHTFMVYETRFIRIHKIGGFVLPYNWMLEDMCIPVTGYIHEESELYAFLKDLEVIVKYYKRKNKLLVNKSIEKNE